MRTFTYVTGSPLRQSFIHIPQTTDGNGLLLYADGVDGDYVALELYDGALFFVADAGVGPRFYKVMENMADDRWHNIEIIQKTDQTFEFHVDDEARFIDLSSQGHTIDLDSYLFVGGVPQSRMDTLTNKINSRKGYAGTYMYWRACSTW